MLIKDGKTGDEWTYVKTVRHLLRTPKVIVTLPNPGSVVTFEFPASRFVIEGEDNDSRRD